MTMNKYRLRKEDGAFVVTIESDGKRIDEQSFSNHGKAMKLRDRAQGQGVKAFADITDDKAPAGDTKPVRVNLTRPEVTKDELPGETGTNAERSTVAEEKMPADEQPMRLAKDKGRAPPPIKQVNKPMRGR